jgi:dihydrofolate reductase
MRARCSVFIATSLDGFISRLDGSIDWLDRANARATTSEDYGYARFFASVDALVMGRKTFDTVRAFDPWPYASKPVIVLSRSLSTLPEGTPATASLSAEEPRALLERLGRDGVSHVYIDGGTTVQRFIREGLVDTITITTIPVLIGQGRPLFAALAQDLELTLIESRAFESGFVQSTYRLDR